MRDVTLPLFVTSTLVGLLLVTPALAAPSLRVTQSAATVYRGPSAAEPALGQAQRDQVYAELERSGGWRKIAYGAETGWCLSADVADSSQAPLRVHAPALNLRSGPATHYRRLASLPQGQLVVVTAESGTWRRVSFEGQVGWVHGSYLSAGAATPAARPMSSAGFIQLPASGPGFYAYSAARARWGLPDLVYGIERACARWRQAGVPRAGVGNLSRERGGKLAPHSSHQRGRNADFRPLRRHGELPTTIHQSAYSRARTQRLVDLVRAEVPVRSILFNDRSVRGVSYYRGHDNHFHVTVR